MREELPILRAVAVRKEEEEEAEEEIRRCMLDGAMGSWKASVGTMTTTQSERTATREERLAIQPAGGHAGTRLQHHTRLETATATWKHG